MTIDEKKKIQEREEKIVTAKANIAKFNAYKRLVEMPEFKLVITEGYVEEYSKELFELQMVPRNLSPYSREELFEKIEAIKTFKQYIGSNSIKSEIEMRSNDANAYLATLE